MKQILFFLLLLPTLSFADYVDNGNKQFYGRIVYIDKQKIILQAGCNGGMQEFRWSDNVSVKFTAECVHPNWELSTSPVTAEFNCPHRYVFELYIKGKNSSTFADEFTISNGNLHIVYSRGRGSRDIPAANLYEVFNWVVYNSYCESDIPASFPVY